MAKFVVMIFWFLAINIGTSGSALQKKEPINRNGLKIEPKIVDDVRAQCLEAKSVDPGMNMNCCATGVCVKLDNGEPNPSFYCDGKHLYSSCTCISFSEALILESVNPQYDKRLFIEFPEKYMLRTNIVLNVKQKNNFCTYTTCCELVFFREFNEQSLVILWVN